jgi:two-component system, NarL family, sensor kinase
MIVLKFSFKKKIIKVNSNKYILLLIFVCQNVFAQTDLQKAKAKVSLAKDYKQQVDALIEYSDMWFNENIDSAKYYARKAEEISKKNNYTGGLFKFYRTYSNFLVYEGKHDESLKYDMAHYKLAVKVGDKENIARSVANLGNSYNYKGDFAKAIAHFQKAIELFKANNQPQYERRITLFICLSFYNSNNIPKAIEYALKGIKMAEEAKDKDLEANALTILSGAYIENKEFDKAEPYLKKAIDLSDSLHLEKDKFNAIADLSRVYFAQNKITQAKNTLAPAISFFRKTNNDYFLVNSLTFLSQYLLAEKNVSEANKAIIEAKTIAEKNKMKAHLPMVYENMVKIKKAEGNYKAAFEYNEKYQIHLDSLSSGDLKKQLQYLDKKYETEKKESQIKLQEAQIKQKTTNNILLISGLVALGLFTLLGFLNYRNRQKLDIQKIKELEQEKQLTAVTSIMQGQEAERSRMARDLHDGLGGMLSGIKLNLSAMKGNQILQETDVNIFNRSIDQLDSAIKEMRRVAHNMMPEALLKFGLTEAVQDFCDGINQAGRVKITFNHIGEAIPNDQSLKVILYRIIQELSNNALKYANANNILIQLSKHESCISLTVEDDGQGFNTKNLEATKGTGLGNVISRVNYLKGTFSIDSEIGKGTSCFVEIPG